MSDSNAGSAINLDNGIADAINNALTNGNPVFLAYADESGQPHISLRGTTQVFSKDRLAVWARDANGGLPSALANNPRLTLMYRNPPERTTYIFYGRGHVEADEEIRNKVFESSPEREQQVDPERKGAAIVIEVDRVEGRTADGPFQMSRS